MSQLNVKATQGVCVPREDNARRYITDAAAVRVDDSAYYRRQIKAGDLQLVAIESQSDALPEDGAPSKPESKAKTAPQEAGRGKS
ncbi:hypothetical protein [Obesumbacterium proteus]|uniref:hypothetical protein n=1 Tax=Obesumbacterium proteus TaxID=82983 RepID=UPI00242F29E5|nr:hypothetical protein [Obesumbacterium proteus]